MSEWSQETSSKQPLPSQKMPISFHTDMKDLLRDNPDIMLLWKANNSGKLLVDLLRTKIRTKIELKISKLSKQSPRN